MPLGALGKAKHPCWTATNLGELVVQHVQTVTQGWGAGLGTSMRTGIGFPEPIYISGQERLLPVILVLGRPSKGFRGKLAI